MLKPRAKEFDLLQEELAEHEPYLLEEEPGMYDEEYDDFLSSVKTALFFMDWVNEKDEEFLLEQYSIRPGEIRAKLEIADWLLYSLEEFSKILNVKKGLKDISKLRIRVKYGVKEELLPLLKLKEIGRVRARKLYRNGIKTVGDVVKADLMKLIQILGKNTAINVKKQVGEEIKEVPVSKRKGQTSLGKF